MEERIEKTFDTPEGCDLVVENVKGEIVVEGWDRPQTEVVAVHRKGKAQIEITQDGKKVIARTTHERGRFGWLEWWGRGNTPVVDYTVHVPRASDLKLKNVNGAINASRVQGHVRVNNVDGEATLHDVAGQIKADNVNGALRVSELQGAAKLNTVNGKISVDGSANSLKADTVNGHIEVQATLEQGGEYTFHTVNGGCHLIVPPDFKAHVSAHRVNLHVDCQVPSHSIDRQFGSWQGTIGEGEGPVSEIKYDTVNGSLRIDNGGERQKETTETVAKAPPMPAEPEPPTPPEAPEEPIAPPEPPEPPEAVPVEVKVAEAPQEKTQTEILEMVERGEISVEEAIKLLQE